MISKKDLKDYQFETIDVYFEYIVESKINGNYSQVRKLIKALNKSQRINLVSWLLYSEHFADQADLHHVLKTLVEVSNE